jgi:ketopantoate hydroxymethyltransferase
MDGEPSIQAAIRRYVNEVKNGRFPDQSHCF